MISLLFYRRKNYCSRTSYANALRPDTYTYMSVEKTKRLYKLTASFTKGKNEYSPLPAAIIDLDAKYGSTLKQHPGS